MARDMIRLTICIALVVGTIAMAASGISSAAAQTSDDNVKEVPINFSADELDVDRELGIVTARGNVEVNREDRTLLADTISYNQKKDLLTASGNITLLEPTGDVIFAQHLEVSGDLKNGIISDIGMILSDRSRVAASGGRRIDGDLELRNAVYSPCNLCPEDPDRAPLWQVKAVKVYHDKSRRIIEYSDAWIEMSGVPVFYTPFLAHPDPTVDRESGFLAPQVGASSDLGFIAKTPYFLVIDDHSDATITPVYYGEASPGLEAEYRQRLYDGKIDLDGSIVNDDTEDLRGHMNAETLFDIDETWRWGFETKLVSDDTYLRRYGFPVADDTLTTTLYSEGFRGRNYARMEGFHFRGLEQNDDEDATPLVLPLASYHHVGKPDRHGGQYLLDASMASITRSNGADSNRLSLHPAWRNRYIAPRGDVYALTVKLRGDLYYASDHVPTGETNEFEGVTGRLFPQAKLDWSLPMVKQGHNFHQVIEPMTSLVLAPNGSNPAEIPNLDSVDVSFNETSLFNDNRFSGVDRVDSGSRVDYGVHWGVTGKGGGKTNVLVGQSVRLRDDDTFNEGSGLEDQVSDVVGMLKVSPKNYIDMTYRMQLDPSDADLRRNELAVGLGTRSLKFNADYRHLDALGSSEFTGREDAYLGVSSQIDRYWRFSASTLQDLDDGQTRNVRMGLTYEDECFIANTEFSRSFFRDRDLQPVDTIMVRISLKTLGNLQAAVF
ncbi:MAG: LPS assembly protein LptD [Rhodospirillales bacterium]